MPPTFTPSRMSAAPISYVRALVCGYWNEPVSVEIAAKRFVAMSRSSGMSWPASSS